jgi:O-antigen/teichoic acid export membrane protein
MRVGSRVRQSDTRRIDCGEGGEVIRRAFERGIAVSLATALGGQLLLVGTGILLARGLGVEGRGQLAIIVLVPSVLSQLGTLGMPLALTYYIAKDADDGRRVLRSLAGVISAQIAVLSVLQIVVFWLLVHDDEQSAMLAAVPILPALIAQQYGLAVLQGQQRFTAFNALRLAPTALYLLAMLAFFAVGATTLVDLVVAFTLINLVAAVPLTAIALRYAAPRGSPSSDHGPRRVFRFGMSALLGSSSPVEMLRVDQAIIALALPRSALGLYVVALAVTNLPRFISQSVGIVAYPRIAAAAPSEKRSLIRRYLLLVLVMAGSTVAFLEATVTRLIPELFGTAFAGAVTTAQILLISAFLLAIRRVLSDIAQGLGYPIGSTVAEAVNLTIALPLIAVAVPLYGIEGAATALTLGAAGSLIVIVAMVRRRMDRISPRDPSDRVVGGDDGMKPKMVPRGEAIP